MASNKATKTNATVRTRSSFGRTSYYIDVASHDASEFKDKGPNQMRAIVKWMIDNEVTDSARALNGAEIGRKVFEDGYATSRKGVEFGPVCFAYYARRMENELGLVLNDVTHAKTGKSMLPK